MHYEIILCSKFTPTLTYTISLSFSYRQEKLAIFDVILCQILTGDSLSTLSSDGSALSIDKLEVSNAADCLATLTSMPIPNIENSKEDPPELTKGKGIP